MSKKIKGFEGANGPTGTGELFPEHREGPQAGPDGGPLANRLRPETLEKFVGQEELLGPGAVLRRMIEEDRLSSVIFWGPPGSGKTTLARIMANRTGAQFFSYSAVLSGAREMKDIMSRARDVRRATGRRTILFVDEVHRFNKAQQDAFLPYVEAGDVILIGATTENPSFEVNSALLSRSQVFVFKPLNDDDIRTILKRAIVEDAGLADANLTLAEEALDLIVNYSDGDARRALSTLDMAVLLARPDDGGDLVISAEDIGRATQRKQLAFDKSGEEHYNIISALHKSVRGSDPDAAVYWLVRMMEAGEDRRYLLRRLMRMATEDIGLADPGALRQATAALQAFDFMGQPEGDLALVQLTVYLSLAPKSNALYKAHKSAVKDVRGSVAHPVPLHLRNAPTRLMRDLDYGRGYEYSHDMPDGVSAHLFFPEELGERKYYRPAEAGFELKLAQRLRDIREKVRRARKG